MRANEEAPYPMSYLCLSQRDNGDVFLLFYWILQVDRGFSFTMCTNVEVLYPMIYLCLSQRNNGEASVPWISTPGTLG